MNFRAKGLVLYETNMGSGGAAAPPVECRSTPAFNRWHDIKLKDLKNTSPNFESVEVLDCDPLVRNEKKKGMRPIKHFEDQDS